MTRCYICGTFYDKDLWCPVCHSGTWRVIRLGGGK